jgi:hypothetical protein
MTFPIIFANNTNGAYRDDQVYLMMLFQAVPGQWCYLEPDGTGAPIDHRDADAPGHLTKNGVNYANMAFTLAELPDGTVFSPPRVGGGRVYVSLGSPMYIGITPDDTGWAGPDLRNPRDPNTDVLFDWYEYAYAEGVTAFGGNTTQVDQFGLPLTARLRQDAVGYDRTVGITASRAEVLSRYEELPWPYRSLCGDYRIVSPRSAGEFYPGGAATGVLDGYIEEVWDCYAGNRFRLERLGVLFEGMVVGDVLRFRRNGSGPYQLFRPTTIDVLAGTGALASGCPEERELGAEFCAAVNRGVALDPTLWYEPAAYYKGPVHNAYARFFHEVGLDGLAYGFSYDDVNDQSTVCILPNADPPTSLAIGIGG